MAETELTKMIKRKLRSYRPEMPTDKRTIRWAEEVSVGTGIVDAIRFEDYIEKDNSYCWAEKCKIEGQGFPCDDCYGCVFKSNSFELGILATCFEIKITKSDFKSKNGHNFVGNHNYYVIPKELYKSVCDLVPDDIGIITYTDNGNLRKKKECKFKELSADDLSRLLFNAMKKWIDKFATAS